MSLFWGGAPAVLTVRFPPPVMGTAGCAGSACAFPTLSSSARRCASGLSWGVVMMRATGFFVFGVIAVALSDGGMSTSRAIVLLMRLVLPIGGLGTGRPWWGPEVPDP